MSAVMMLEIVVGIVILAAAVWFAVRETQRLKAAMDTDVEPVETAPVSEPVFEHNSEPEVPPAAEPAEQEAEQLSEVSATETK